MIAFIEGKLVVLEHGQAVVQAGGVGYLLRISLQTHAVLQQQAGTVKVHTWLHVKEDAHTLYGFADVDEKELFLLLITVNGVGPGTALVMLSGLDTGGMLQAISSGDIRTIQALKGIGPKTAQRIVLELQDKIQKTGSASINSTLIGSMGGNTARSEALTALVTLGFARPAAEKLVDATVKKYPELTTEQIIKSVLKGS